LHAGENNSKNAKAVNGLVSKTKEKESCFDVARAKKKR